MKLYKRISCYHCKKYKVCSLRKGIMDQIEEGNKLGVFAVYAGDAPLLSYQILYAVAACCKFFEQINWKDLEKEDKLDK